MPQMPASVSSLSARASTLPVVARRKGVAGEARLVVLGNRLRHLRRLAVVPRIVAAHDALQFRELADHSGQQVGLGEQARRA